MSLKCFWKNSTGNVSIMMGIAILPVLFAIGAGIDIERQINVQTKLQAAVDAAVLAGGASKLTTSAQVKAVINEFMKANDATDSLKSVGGLTIKVDNKAGVFSVNIKGTIDTGLMNLAGIPTLNVGAYSEVAVPYEGAEIVLALDNTASMASEGRLDALKLSAKSLVTTVLSHKQASTYVKIGIVPFADYVNVGLSNRGSSWMNVPKDYTTTDPNYCSISYPDASSSNCHDAQGVWNNDGVPTKYTYQVCDWVMGNPVTTCSPQTYQHKWYGCVGSRPSPMDQSIGSASQAYPGILDTGCTNEITDLTDKLATLTSAIDAMVASGNTYIPSGLLWGWNMLDSSAPLTTAKSKSAMAAIHGSKSLVLMTDGDNTLSPGNGADYKYHWGNDVVYANKMTADLCQNIKDDGVNVFTVAFKVANTTSLQVLQDCASSPTQAYDATNDAELQAAFDQIGSSLAQLRITK